MFLNISVVTQLSAAGRANHRGMAENDRLRREAEFDDFFERLRRERQAERDALATVRRFNAIMSARRYVWFWPKISAALTAKHPWVIACDSCGIVNYLDLRICRA